MKHNPIKSFFFKCIESGSSLITISGIALSVASLIPVLNAEDTENVHRTLIILAMIFALLIIVIEFKNIYNKKLFNKNDSDSINSFIDDFIKCEGALVIFSSSLSWIKHGTCEQTLQEKSKDKLLTIIMPSLNTKAEEFKSLGAEVIYCKDIVNPKSRFTIVNSDRHDSHIAIGQMDNNLHKIIKYKAGDPAMSLADDLVNILRAKKGIQGEN